MKPRFTYISIILIMMITQSIVLADRHTPGFPDVTILINPLRDYVFQRDLLGLLRNLIEIIENSDVRSELKELVEKYKPGRGLNSSDILNTLREIEKHDLNSSDKLLALAILDALASYSNDTYVQLEIDPRLRETGGKYIDVESTAHILKPLADSIENTRLRESIEALVNRYSDTGSVSREELVNTLKYIVANKDYLSREDIARSILIIEKLARIHNYVDIVEYVEKTMIELNIDQGTQSRVEKDMLIELTESIRNNKLRARVEELVDKYTRGVLSESDIQQLLHFVHENRDSLSIEDIYRSLGLINTIYNATYTIPPQLLKDLVNIVLHSEILKSINSSIKPQEHVSNLNINNENINNEMGENTWPHIPIHLPKPPIPAFTLPTIVDPGQVVLWILVIVFSIALIATLTKLHGVASSSRRRVFRKIRIPFRWKTSKVSEIDKAGVMGVDEVIRNYWSAVKYIGEEYDLVKYPHETHREYYTRIEPSLRDKAKLFEEITYIYEKTRFGLIHSSELREKSRELLHGLREGSR